MVTSTSENNYYKPVQAPSREDVLKDASKFPALMKAHKADSDKTHDNLSYLLDNRFDLNRAVEDGSSMVRAARWFIPQCYTCWERIESPRSPSPSTSPTTDSEPEAHSISKKSNKNKRKKETE